MPDPVLANAIKPSAIKPSAIKPSAIKPPARGAELPGPLPGDPVVAVDYG